MSEDHKMSEWLKDRLEEEAFLRKQLEVTEPDYRAAVESLMTLAEDDTSGARAAAQVLLGLYNGYTYKVDLTDLCVLDLGYLQKALIAIRGRVMLMKEPHTLIPDGGQRFDNLGRSWAHLFKTSDEL